ncbi:hypothetical protein JCM8097_001476 [Rhodosporidiobolus ruineniae]
MSDADKSSNPSAGGGWGSTLTAALSYATIGGGGAGARTTIKGKARAALPDWSSGAQVDDGPVKASRRRSASEGALADFDSSEAVKEVEGEEDNLHELAESILWQAGTDYGDPPGPLLVIACSRIPPPTEVSHPDLLIKLRLRLEAFASSGPYSVVLLVNPTPHAPATAHLVSAYLSLTRMARKNLRRAYVVGGGWWTRVILTLFSTTLLSAKTAKRRKIVQCSTLNSLAQELGSEAFVQIEFPLEVYSANTDTEIKLPPSNPPMQRTFGVPLKELTGKDGDRLPPLVRDCVDVLLAEGPDSVGIFRRSPSASTVKTLEGAYDRGHPVSLSSLPDAPYLAASLLKLFLRSLPAPILPPALYPVARACPLMDDAALPYLRSRLLPLLDPPSLLILQQLIAVLSAVAANAQTNLMTSENLVICLCPGLIGGIGASREEVEMCRVPNMDVGSMRGMRKVSESGRNTVGGVLRVMIDHYDGLFDPSTLTSLTPALRRPLIGSDLDLTPSPSSALPVTSTSFPAISASPSLSLSPGTGSLHSAPHSPIVSIPEADEGDDPAAAEAAPGSSPPPDAAAVSARRPSAASASASLSTLPTETAASSMARTTSLSSLASSSSFASAASSTTSRSPGRTGTLRLKKTSGGILLDSLLSPGGGGAGSALTVGEGALGEGEGAGLGGTIRRGKSREVVTVQQVEGEFARGPLPAQEA